MLKLKRLELSGFKSFVDPVSLEFAGGLTAIVGPNGCGKSNLADAVTWVLGEQSAKTLRGDRMEDVIFNGAEGRRPVGMGEVTLTLETDPGFPHSQDGRVTIGRRVFRSGESQYRLNGKVVRLKEIKDLLMDTGLGIRAYSVIEQGKIGMILSGKPQERRRLLEEAAGITRYKARKRVAEVKLEEAAANLLRLSDIISEVERSLRSLKRQAAAARRYEERQAEHRELLRRVLLGRWAGLRARLDALHAALGAATAREAEFAAGLHAGEAELAAAREGLEALGEELSARHRSQAELAAAIEGRQEFLKGARQRREEIAERLAAGRAEAELRRAAVAEGREALARLEERRADLIAERDRAADGVSTDAQRIAASEERVAAAEGRLDELRARLLVSLGELSDLRNRLHREQVEAEKGGYRRKKAAEELERRAAELAAAAAAAEEAEGAVSGLESAVTRAEAEVEVARRRSSELERAAEELGERERRAEAELAAAQQRRRFLGELAEAHAERRELIRRALAEAGAPDPEFLADRLRAAPGWEASLDLFLGELADAVIAPPGSDPLELARAIGAGAGSAQLLLPAEGQPESPIPEDPAIRASLAQALGLPAALAAALPPAFLVDEPGDAVRLARAHPGIAFVARGRLWARGGVVGAQGESGRPGVLGRDRELAETGERIEALESQLSALRGDIASLGGERQALRRHLDGLDSVLAARRQELAVTRARRDDLGGRHRRLRVEHETLETEAQEIERELARVVDRERRLAADLAAAEAAHASLESDFDRAQGAVDAARGERESVRTGGASRRGRLELFEERLLAHDQEAARVRREIDEAEERDAAWAAAEASLQRRGEEVGAASAVAEAELQEALERRASGQAEVTSDAEALEDRRAAVRAREGRVAAVREELEGARSEIGERRVEKAAVEKDAEHLAANWRDEIGEPLPASAPAPPDDLPALEAELARCKEALERLGPVNLLAGHEYSEQEERQRFLTAQKADVEASVASLRKTIREINQTSSERFIEAFRAVNAHFSDTFRALFRGGEAEMRLLDEEDLLESGIEIVARPPGKRLQNIMLLSGGEKALTAIALLFALFRTKPSPFCILDEVDAPLDDVNTLRFVDHLKEMAAGTQFIVVTHNKITMQAAALLYGVTMEERGVSKVVSVRLEEIEPESRAASA